MPTPKAAATATEGDLLADVKVQRAIEQAVYRFLSAHPRFYPLSEDAKSEGTIAAMDAIRGYNGTSALPTRVYSVVRYRLLDWARTSPTCMVSGVGRVNRMADLDPERRTDRRKLAALALTTDSLDARYPDGQLVHDTPGTLDVLGPIEDRDEFTMLVRPLLKALKRKERDVVLHYYLGDTTLAETGRLMGLSESRICQLHTRAMAKLRAAAGALTAARA